MIRFEIKNQETGKTESYKKDFITLGEAEKCYTYLEEQGLTEETILNNMSTKTYTKAIQDIFREVNGDDEEDTEIETEEAGKTGK